MSDGASLPAGWYDDPAGTGGHRWWAGTQWTDHVRAPEPVAPAFTPPEPLPFAGSAVQEYQPMAYTTATAFPSAAPDEYRFAGRVDVDNTKGWLSLGGGVVSLALLAAASIGGVVLIGTLTAVIFTITSGIRSLSLRSRGMSTVLIPPVLGIVFAGLTVLIFLGGILVSAIGVAATSAEFLSEQTRQSFPENPELQAMYDTAYDIQSQLTDELRTGTLPEQLEADASGEIRLDGELLAIIDAGQIFDYSLIEGGTHYEFTLHGTVLGESIRFSSKTGNLYAVCFEDDETCGF